jgi:hypothetical protein
LEIVEPEKPLCLRRYFLPQRATRKFGPVSAAGAGLGEGPMQLDVRETYEALFRDMFYGVDQKSGANIRILDSDLGKRELEIYYKKSNVYRLPLEQEKEPEAFLIDPIQFKWDFGNDIVHSQVVIKDGALQMTGDAKVYPLFLISPRTARAGPAGRFGQQKFLPQLCPH